MMAKACKAKSSWRRFTTSPAPSEKAIGWICCPTAIRYWHGVLENQGARAYSLQMQDTLEPILPAHIAKGAVMAQWRALLPNAPIFMCGKDCRCSGRWWQRPMSRCVIPPMPGLKGTRNN